MTAGPTRPPPCHARRSSALGLASDSEEVRARQQRVPTSLRTRRLPPASGNAERCHMGVEETPLLHRITGSQVHACGPVTAPGEVCVLTKSLTTDVSGVLPRLSGMRCPGTFERDRNRLVSLARCLRGRTSRPGWSIPWRWRVRIMSRVEARHSYSLLCLGCL